MKESIYPLKFPIKRTGTGPQYRFGMKQQGCFDFVQRAIADGMGWRQIAKCIGWIGFSAMKEYTQVFHADFMKQNHLLIDAVNVPPYRGSALYDQNTKTIDIYQGMNSTDRNAFNENVVCAQFLVLDPTVFQSGPISAPEFYLINDHEPSRMTFHAYMTREGREELLQDPSYMTLLHKIILMQKQGFLLSSSLFFDLVDIKNSKKAQIDEAIVKQDMNNFQ
ncbi:hypothetical protein D3C87_892370 [compost metagenome]